MSELITPNSPPRPALAATDEKCWVYKATRDRLPVIITATIDDVYRAYNAIDNEYNQKEGQEIIEKITALKYDLQQDKLLIPIEDDGESDVAEWTHVFTTYFADKSWFSATWLFIECYLYRRMRSTFAKSTSWCNYDPYFAQKENTFKISHVSVIELAKRIDQLINNVELRNGGEEAKRIVFHELAQICLWGNGTDLSLLSNLSYDNVRKLQITGSVELQANERNILVNELDRLWEKAKQLHGARVDIVLDNAGFELYVDLVFADWLIQAGYAHEIKFHAKAFPCFVSDTTLVDFDWLLNALGNGFFADAEKSQDERLYLDKLVTRWRGYIAKGQWVLQANRFWTLPYAYWHFPEKAPELFGDICKAALVIFKGDLNYRKLVYDCKWPFTTQFVEAIGPLATKKGIPAIVTLRTCKSDVVVGLPEGVEEQLSAVEPDWLYSGKYAVVQFSPGKL